MPEQGTIEFHLAAFTDRSRHFLHVREDEIELLKEMGTIYKGIQPGRYRTSEDEHKLRTHEVLKTQEAILRNIRRNVSDELRNALNTLYDRAKRTFLNRGPLSEYLNDRFTEKIKGYAATGTPPTADQLRAWLPPDTVDSLRHAKIDSMQDAHAEIVKHVWKKDDADIYVLSGTPGIGKTTALRNILADYDQGYLLVYVSPRLQVNTDLVAKFDPTDERNHLVGKEEIICLNTNRGGGTVL